MRFLKSFVAHPRRVGAVLPTSRRAVRDMLDLAPLQSASVVLELGAGTGSHTGEILARLRPDARLLAFEIDPDLAQTISDNIDDARLVVIADSAERMQEQLAGAKADIVVSALPFASLPASVRVGVLDAVERVLAPGGSLLVLQYSPIFERELRRRYRSVRRRISLVNVPPAMLFCCTDPVSGSSAAA